MSQSPESPYSFIDDAIADAVGGPQVGSVIVAGQIDAHYKPTLVLVDEFGAPTAYAKVGWTPGTAVLVRREIGAHEQLGSRISASLRTPVHLARGEHVIGPFVASAPMPSRSAANHDPDPDPAILADLVGEVRCATVAEVIDSLQRTSTARATPYRNHAFNRGVRALQEAWRGSVTAGRAHGDWVPWNMAEAGPHTIAWDWEHFRQLAPVGVDSHHWYVFSSRYLGSASWDSSIRLAIQANTPILRLLQASASSVEVALFHSLWLLARSDELEAPGLPDPYPVDAEVLGLAESVMNQQEIGPR